MRPLTERRANPSKEDVAALASVDEANRMAEEVELSIARIEADLEFPSDRHINTDGWEQRAKLALASVRVVRTRIQQRIRQLTRDPSAETPEQAQARGTETKAQRRLAHEQNMANQLERRRLDLEAQRLAEDRKLREQQQNKTFEGHFVIQAQLSVGPETFASIVLAATEAMIADREAKK